MLDMKQIITAVVVLSAVFVRAEEPKKQPEFTVGELRVQSFPEFNFAYVSAETTFDKIAQTIEKSMAPLAKALEEGKFRPTGTMLFVYKGVAEDMSKPFTLEIGYIVNDGAKAGGEVKLRKTPAYKCATVLYSGAIANLSKGYEKLFGGLGAAGLTPVQGEFREMYLYWEKPESVNNVVQLQVGVK